MKDKKPVYTKCPRCELNYIQKKQNYCDVCKAEMRLIDPSILIPDEEEEEIICPVCKINYMASDEEMCFMCSKEAQEKLKEVEPDDWSVEPKEADVIEDDELEIPLSSLEEEDDIIESFDDEGPVADDFDYVSADELDEYDEDEDEDEEEDDTF